MALWLGGTELWTQLLLLLLAFVLSAVIGVERERRLKSAGLRTHILVGLGSALFTLVSAYGFAPLGLPTTDPSRIAAQVVTGIGFVGAGVIFVNRGNVVGLTTAASIWVTAAVGMACGAGLPVIAVAGTLLHLIAVGTLPTAERVLRRTSVTVLTVRASTSGETLARVVDVCEAAGPRASIHDLRRTTGPDGVELRVRIRASAADTQLLAAQLAALDGVTTVRTGAPVE
ncbi:MgtC/SapB family protein [Leifsonia sp. fls2-241-R2A-40a]|uniref:MgtC/SapB family protein n=1 Tax=Leifsonia sp. fls2-241-R2A-40a TaxID=3040290 RepID=UPI00254EE80B|nr:MgtC/SapB family protein [Leifsonia sp. fls2-241-R2A-40a]